MVFKRLSVSVDLVEPQFRWVLDVLVEIESMTPRLLVDRAQFRAGKDRWRVDGRARIPGPGNTVSIHLGPTIAGPVIGTAEVDALGDWAFAERSSPNPPGAETQISVSSSANGVDEAIDIVFK